MDNKLSDNQTKQLANYLNVPEKDVANMAVRMGARDVSLNAPASNSDERDVLANLPSGAESIENTVEDIEFKRKGYNLLKKHLADLSDRDREILIARRLKDPAQTLEVLSKKYKISRERVRQIEERAYKKLKEAILKDVK